MEKVYNTEPSSLKMLEGFADCSMKKKEPAGFLVEMRLQGYFGGFGGILGVLGYVWRVPGGVLGEELGTIRRCLGGVVCGHTHPLGKGFIMDCWICP